MAPLSSCIALLPSLQAGVHGPALHPPSLCIPCILAQPTAKSAALEKLCISDVHAGHISAVLQGVDRVMCVNAADASTLLLRQYRIRLKKTGTKASVVMACDVVHAEVYSHCVLWVMPCALLNQRLCFTSMPLITDK